MNTLRTQDRSFDQTLLETVGKRMKVAEEIGQLKGILMLLYYNLKGGMK